MKNKFLFNFIYVVKVVLYLASVVLPAIDAIKGIKKGIILGHQDALKEKERREYLLTKQRMDAGYYNVEGSKK